MSYTEAIALFFIGAAILMAIFLVMREFWCWFWKINEYLKIAKLTNANINVIRDKIIKIEKKVNEK